MKEVLKIRIKPEGVYVLPIKAKRYNKCVLSHDIKIDWGDGHVLMLRKGFCLDHLSHTYTTTKKVIITIESTDNEEPLNIALSSVVGVRHRHCLLDVLLIDKAIMFRGDVLFKNCVNLRSMPKDLDYKIFHGINGMFLNCTSLPKQNVGLQILEEAECDLFIDDGLCVIFSEIISKLMLESNAPICLQVELPHFTNKNAIKYCNGVDKAYWFTNNTDRLNFLRWLKINFNKK